MPTILPLHLYFILLKIIVEVFSLLIHMQLFVLGTFFLQISFITSVKDSVEPHTAVSLTTLLLQCVNVSTL